MSWVYSEKEKVNDAMTEADLKQQKLELHLNLVVKEQSGQVFGKRTTINADVVDRDLPLIIYNNETLTIKYQLHRQDTLDFIARVRNKNLLIYICKINPSNFNTIQPARETEDLLRNAVRASELHFNKGEKVFYKKADENNYKVVG